MGILAITLVFGMTITACDNGGGGGDDNGGNNSGGGGKQPFTSISDMRNWLAAQPENTAETAYTVMLNVSTLRGGYASDGSSETYGNAGNALNLNKTKYVNLDLSGSTITSIERKAFMECTSLTGITIPSSVTGIGSVAFWRCTNLTSVTFQGTIASNDFSYNRSFYGDLRKKYLATGGGIGTYTTTAPVSERSVWTKQ